MLVQCVFILSKSAIEKVLKAASDCAVEEIVKSLPALKQAIENGLVEITTTVTAEMNDSVRVIQEKSSKQLWEDPEPYKNHLTYWAKNLPVCHRIILVEAGKEVEPMIAKPASKELVDDKLGANERIARLTEQNPEHERLLDGNVFDTLQLGKRARKILNKLAGPPTPHKMTVRWLVGKTVDELYEVKGCGRTTVAEIQESLQIFNLNLKGDF
jgi:hypothetical protein